MQAAIDFAGNLDRAVLDVDHGSEGALGQVGQSSQHLASLVVVAIDGLLAKDNHIGRLVVIDGLEALGHGQRLQIVIALDQDAAIRAQRHGGANLFLGLLRPDGDCHHFGGDTLFLQAHRFFHGNFAKRVDGHLDVCQIHGSAVGLGANLHVVINHTFNGYKYLHELTLASWKVMTFLAGGLNEPEPAPPLLRARHRLRKGHVQYIHGRGFCSRTPVDPGTP